MVATIRNWAFDPNHVVVGANEDAQAQDSWFRCLELFRGNVGVDQDGTSSSAGAWAVHSSSDGSATAGLGDNIAASTDIVFDSAGNNHSWIVFFLTFGSRTLYVCIDFVVPGASPFRSTTVVLFPGAPTVTGTLTARPTHTNEAVMANTTFSGAAGFVPKHAHGWRSTIGEILFLFSVDGTAIAETALWIPRPDNGESGILWKPNVYYAHSISALGALGHFSLNTPTRWETFWQDDTPLLATINLKSVFGNTSSTAWTNGRSNIGANPIGDAPIDIIWNSPNEAAYAGRIVDMRVTPENVPDNETQDGDTDLVRRITVGEMWVPNRAAAGALVL